MVIFWIDSTGFYFSNKYDISSFSMSGKVCVLMYALIMTVSASVALKSAFSSIRGVILTIRSSTMFSLRC